MTKEEFLWLVYQVSTRTDGSCTSWFRCPARNIKVGGVANSRHLDGRAVDLVFETLDGKMRAATMLRFFELDVIDEGDHLHVEIP